MSSKAVSVLLLRFHVLMEILKPDKPDATVSLRGLDFIEVPALANRDYNISFFTYREGQYSTKVWSLTLISSLYLIPISEPCHHLNCLTSIHRWHFAMRRQASTCSTTLYSRPHHQESSLPLIWWPLSVGQSLPLYRWRTPWPQTSASLLSVNVLTLVCQHGRRCQDCPRCLQSSVIPIHYEMSVCLQTSELTLRMCILFRVLWALSTSRSVLGSPQPGWLYTVMNLATSITICFSRLCLRLQRKQCTSVFRWATANLFLLSSSTILVP